MQALLGYTSEARWLRYAKANLTAQFPYLPRQPGYNKRLRRLAPNWCWYLATHAHTATFGDRAPGTPTSAAPASPTP